MLSQGSHYHGNCSSFVTALFLVTFIQDIQMIFNAGWCGRLCLNLLNHPETAVNQLNVRRPDRHQVDTSHKAVPVTDREGHRAVRGRDSNIF
jgi:hypothetical protein